MNNNLKPSEKICSPFMYYCQKVIPLAFDESMSYYEQLCNLVYYLKNTVMPAVNNNADALTEVQNAFTQLEKYVNDYFKNLDVQTEINNKLDEMAESGQLSEIIALYIQSSAVLGYKTVADMKNATNLVDGSICKTISNTTVGDNGGRFYLVRTITSSDVVDEVNIISLSVSNTLIAQLINDDRFINLANQIDNKIGNLNDLNTTNKSNVVNGINEVYNKIGNLNNLNTTDKSNVVNAINEVYNKSITSLPNKPIDMKKVIFIGDSYASRNDNWVNPLITKLGLESGDYYIGALGSTGFCSPNNNKVWLTLLQEIVENLTSSQKQEITHIIVCGGANDNTYALNEIDTAIGNFVAYVNTNLPNAKTLIGEIGWTNDPEKIVDYGKVVEAYTKCTKNNNCYYLNNVQYTLHNYNLLLGDGVHPTANGNLEIANNIHQCIMTGFCDVVYSQLRHKLNPNNNNETFFESLNNQMVCVYNNRPSSINVNVASLTANGLQAIDLTDDIFEYAKGNYYESNRTYINAYITANGVKKSMQCTIGVYQGKLKLYPLSYDANNYETLSNITNVFIPQFKIVMDALQC